MAKRAKSIEVSKFGGTEKIADVKLEHDYEVSSMEAESETKLEHDEGHGAAIVIRCFKFGINPDAFRQYSPTKQELFNSHMKGIETALWRDGLKVFPDVEPRIVVNQEAGTYEIFVGAHPMKGQTLYQTPQTLSQIAHG